MNGELLLLARGLGLAVCLCAAWLQGRARTGLSLGIAFCCCLLAMRMLGEEPSELIAWMALVPLFSLGAWGELWDTARFRPLATGFMAGIGVLALGCAAVAMVYLGTETIQGEQQDAFVSLVPPSWAVGVCGLALLATGLPVVIPRPALSEPSADG